MSKFKNKPDKKIISDAKYTTTINEKHSGFMSEFTLNDLNTIPMLVNEREKLKNALSSITMHMNKQDIKYEIKCINLKIKSLKNKKHNYLLNNSKLLFAYFDITQNNNEDQNIGQYSKSMCDFFKITTQEDQQSSIDLSQSRTEIVNQYLTNVDESYIDNQMFIKESDICEFCNRGEMVQSEDDGLLICTSCFNSMPYLIENEKPSYKEPPKEVCFYAYRRQNRFKEIIAQFQAKETTKIPDDIFNLIVEQIKKERLELGHLSYYKMKDVLKKLSLSKYYGHIAFIKNKLGIPPPSMSIELEYTLNNLFMELLAPYSKCCPDDKFNFLNHYYVLYKLCELLDETKYLDIIPMLKDEHKISDQDDIWKKMMDELGWKFTRTFVCGDRLNDPIDSTNNINTFDDFFIKK